MLKKSVIFLSTSLFLTGVSMPSFAQDLEAARQAIEDALPGKDQNHKGRNIYGSGSQCAREKAQTKTLGCCGKFRS